MVKSYHSCKLVTRTRNDTELHELHLETNNLKWMPHQDNLDVPLQIALISKYKVSRQPRCEHLFAILHLNSQSESGETENDQEDAQTTVMYCTEDFMKWYKLSSNDFYFTVVKPLGLDKVILGALTQETFDWANQESFERGLLFAHTSNRPLLFRQGDHFLSEPNSFYGDNRNKTLYHFQNLVTLSCSPWKQGLCTEKTSIVIVKTQDSNVRLQWEEEEQSTDIGNSFSVKIDEKLDNLTGYTGSSISISKRLATELDVEDDDFLQVALFAKKKSDEFICGTSTDLEITTESRAQRLLVVNTIEEELLDEEEAAGETNLLHFSPVAWFNLIGSEKCLQPSEHLVEVEKVTDEPVFAREVHISLIMSPLYNPSTRYDRVLRKRLATKCFCKIGDVLTFKVADDVDFYISSEKNHFRCEYLHFKVLGFASDETNPQGYLIDVQHTNLYQEASTNDFVPYPRPVNYTAPGMGKYVSKLTQIINPYLHSNSLQHPCTVLLSGDGGSGKHSVVKSVCQQLGMHILQIDCLRLVSESPGAGEAKVAAAFAKALKYLPCLLVLNGIDYLVNSGDSGGDREEGGRMVNAFIQAVKSMKTAVTDDSSHPLVLVATTRSRSSVSSDISSLMVHHIEVAAPSEEERVDILNEMMKDMEKSTDLNLRAVAKSTAGFLLGDMWELVRKVRTATHVRLIEKRAVGQRLSYSEEQLICISGFTTSKEDFDRALEVMQNEKADSIGVPRIPNVSWEDIGGLEEVKNDILDTVQLPLDFPELVANGLNRSGVLLYGPPGTGKTLLAKAVACQCSLTFLSVKGPELINMYVGQSEENVRRVFERARNAAPCVVFFDELDALAPNRGRSGDSGGVMDRIVSQLLAELDGVNSAEDADKQVFVIAASNRPDLIDPSLLRPGRFDKLVYVGVNGNKKDRLKILQAQTRKMNVSPTVELDQVIDICPPNLTGADFRALVNEAAMNAIRRSIANLEQSQTETTDNIGLEPPNDRCVIEYEDFQLAADHIQPSVSTEQLEDYKRIHKVMVK